MIPLTTILHVSHKWTGVVIYKTRESSLAGRHCIRPLDLEGPLLRSSRAKALESR